MWLRLTRDPERNHLGFWRRVSESADEWPAVARELDRLLKAIPPSDRPAIDSASTYWPNGWEYWGPGVPKPIMSLVLSGEVERAAMSTECRPLE
jgi:hypothetical protein